MKIGLDFDNTIINYNKVFYNIARKLKLIDENTLPLKDIVRDKIRSLRGGEKKWQEVQALVYGIYINEAQIFEGFSDFIKKCRQAQFKVYIISHKTKFAKFNDNPIELRKPAILWMEQKGFFNELNFDISDIFFLDRRLDKIEKIKELKCNIFVDDLIEVFLEKSFPDETIKFLFNPGGMKHYKIKDIISVDGWHELTQKIFGTS